MQDLFCQANDWKSVYQYDYSVKKNLIKRIPEHKKYDPIFCPYFNYLHIDECRQKPEPPDEELSEFTKRLEKTNKIFEAKYGNVENRYDFLCKEYERNLRSVYQKDICHDDDVVQKGKRPFWLPFYHLPDNWYYPSTTQRWSYRNPRSLIDLNVRGQSVRPSNKSSLVLSDKMKGIMKVSTGNTEYQGRYDELGKFIIERGMHGEIKH